MSKIIDYRLSDNEKELYGATNDIYTLILITSDNKEIIDENLLVTEDTMMSLEKPENKEETLRLLNKINADHIKQKLLNINIPIYVIGCNPNSGVEVILAGFNIINKNEPFIVPSYVEYVMVNNRDCVDTIEIKHRVTLSSIYNDRVKIIGLENVEYLTDEILERLKIQVSKSNTNTIKFKYLKQLALVQYNIIFDITRIEFENTCTLKEISMNMLTRMYDLKEIILCDSIEIIRERDNSIINIRKDLKRDKATGNLYIELKEWEGLKRIKRRITLKYHSEMEKQHYE